MDNLELPVGIGTIEEGAACADATSVPYGSRETCTSDSCAVAAANAILQDVVSQHTRDYWHITGLPFDAQAVEVAVCATQTTR